MLEIMDTAGTEQFTSMRELYMREAQGFLLVFSITSLNSLNELNELREQIVNVKNDPYVPIVLVGNKCDLEDDRQVSRSRAYQISQQWGNVPYYETSARRRQNVSEVFVDVCRQIIRREQSRASQAPSSSHRQRYEDTGYRNKRPKRRDREYHRDRGGRDRGHRCIIL